MALTATTTIIKIPNSASLLNNSLKTADQKQLMIPFIIMIKFGKAS